MSESKKRITLVDVVLERKGSMLFEGRKVKIPNDAANIVIIAVKILDNTV